MNHTGRSFAIFAVVVLVAALWLTQTHTGRQVMVSLTAAMMQWKAALLK